MKPIGLPWIIHIFALFHAGVALGCRLAGFDDQLLLTVLTMAMSLILCMRMGLKIEFTAAIVIIVNILGFMLGTFGANVLQSIIHSDYVVHCFSTTVTTEILGWCIVGITKIFGQKEVETDEFGKSPYMKWLLLISSGIFILRFLIVVMSRSVFEQDVIFEMIRKYMTNSFSLIMLICVNVLFIRSMTTRDESSSRLSTSPLL